MKKTFNYKGFSVVVKTNMLKDGIIYFGDLNIEDEIKTVYRDIEYSNSNVTAENKLITIYNFLKSKNIKPLEITYGDLTYTGVIMTDVKKSKEVQMELE